LTAICWLYHVLEFSGMSHIKKVHVSWEKKISMFFAESNSEHYVKLILTQLSGELTVEEKILESTL